MITNRVRFSDKNKFHEIPVDKLSVTARQKFSLTKPTKYDPHNCEICKISCNSKKIYDMHVMGKKHNKAQEKLEESKFPCEICSLTLENLDSWQNHLNSQEHLHTQLRNFTFYTGRTPNIGIGKINYCDICKLDCGSSIILQSHLTGAKHKRKLKVLKIDKLKESKDSSVYCEVCCIYLEPELMQSHKLSGKHKKPITKDNNSNPRSKGGMEFCALCNKDLPVNTEAIEHYESTNHLDNVKNKENIFWCQVCKIILPNESMMSDHLKGFRHYRILNREECLFEGTYKAKLLFKRQKQKELRAHYEKEKFQLEHID